MPLNTQIIRGGETMTLKWGQFHVAAMVEAASFDSGEGPYEDMEDATANARRLMEEQGCIGIDHMAAFSLAMYPVISMTPLNNGEYTLKERWVFTDTTDGEELELLPGDVLRMYRS